MERAYNFPLFLAFSCFFLNFAVLYNRFRISTGYYQLIKIIYYANN